MSGLPTEVRDPDAEEADAMPESQDSAQDPEQDPEQDAGKDAEQEAAPGSSDLVEDETAEADAAEPDTTDSEAAAKPAPGKRGRLLTVGILLLAAVVLVSGLVAWWRASHDDRTATAERRDAVVVAATQAIETMNSLDYHDVEAGLKKWLAVTTGTLHDQLSQVGAPDRKLLADQKKISTGKVVDAAVVDLDTSSATVIASVEVTVRDGADTAAKPAVKRNRFTADLERTGGTWKLASLEQVAVNLQ